MKPQASVLHDDFDEPLVAVEEVDGTSEDDLWLMCLDFVSIVMIRHIYHIWRHIDRAGIDRNAVQNAIRSDLRNNLFGAARTSIFATLLSTASGSGITLTCCLMAA